jgi:SAM-dependent methyltransferase
MINKIKSSIKGWVLAFIYPRPFIGIFYLPRYFRSLLSYKRLENSFPTNFSDLQPCLGDWTPSTPFDPHYFYQGAWAVRKLRDSGVAEHVDIASSVLMISVLSGYIDTTFVDYRPLKTNLSGLRTMPGDILSLPFEDGSINSLSCLHVIEHIGLGRYGDPLDPLGTVKAAKELQRILAIGGILLVSLPVGRERICFNAHRVHSPMTILQFFSCLTLIDFSYVDDDGKFHENANPADAINLEYGCGLFNFSKT